MTVFENILFRVPIIIKNNRIIVIIDLLISFRISIKTLNSSFIVKIYLTQYLSVKNNINCPLLVVHSLVELEFNTWINK